MVQIVVLVMMKSVVSTTTIPTEFNVNLQLLKVTSCAANVKFRLILLELLWLTVIGISSIKICKLLYRETALRY